LHAPGLGEPGDGHRSFCFGWPENQDSELELDRTYDGLLTTSFISTATARLEVAIRVEHWSASRMKNS